MGRGLGDFVNCVRTCFVSKSSVPLFSAAVDPGIGFGLWGISCRRAGVKDAVDQCVGAKACSVGGWCGGGGVGGGVGVGGGGGSGRER